jgi:hypothetical protein
VLPDNDPDPITPTVAGTTQYTFPQPSATKYTLTHQTYCTAAGNTNDARTTIGIGEAVEFGGMPTNTVWTLVGKNSSISPTNGFGTRFIASMSPGSASVIATVGSQSQATTFTIIPPSTITVCSQDDLLGKPNPGGTQMGGGNQVLLYDLTNQCWFL